MGWMVEGEVIESVPRNLVHEIIHHRRRSGTTPIAVCHRLLDQSWRVRIGNSTIALPLPQSVISSLWTPWDDSLSLWRIRGEAVKHSSKSASFIGILKGGEDVLRDFEEMAVLVEELGGDEIGHCGYVRKSAVANADGFQIHRERVLFSEDSVGEVGDLEVVSGYINSNFRIACSYLR